MAAQAEQDGTRPPFLTRHQRFVHRGTDGVRRFWRRHDSFGPGEGQRGLEHRQLAIRSSLDLSEFQQVAEQRRRAVIAQPPGVNTGGTKSCPRVYILISGVNLAVSP